MNMVAAIISLCLINGQCQSITVKVEPSACRLPSYQAEAPIDGEWKKAVISIRCKK